jgi:hypothetical protein
VTFGLIILKMRAQAGDEFLIFAFRVLALQLVQRKMNHIVVVQLFRRNQIAVTQPELVNQIYLIGRQMGSVRAQ